VNGLNVVHSEMVGSVKVSAVFDRFSDEMKNRIRSHNVDVSPVPVQKLFIYLAGNGREEMQCTGFQDAFGSGYLYLGQPHGIMLACVNFILTALILYAAAYLISRRQPQTAPAP